MSLGSLRSSLTALRSHLIEIELTPDLVVIDPLGPWIPKSGERGFQILSFFEIDLESLYDEAALGTACGPGEGLEALGQGIR